MRKLLLGVLLVVPAFAQSQATEPIAFAGTNVRDNSQVALSDFKDRSGVVVIFTGYQCPFDGYYRLRIKEFIDTYSERVPILLVNSYLEPEEAVDKMKMEAVALGYRVPYLADKEQKIMNTLGAKKSPEVFVLKRTGASFSVLYSGAIDDNPQLPSAVKENYLTRAIENLLAGKSGTSSVRATGCTIRKR